MTRSDYVYEELMARIGVGTATLTLKLQRTRFAHGESIEGTLTLEGGAVEQHIERLFVKFLEYHQAGKNSYWETREKVTIAEAILVAPHQVQEYAFRLPVPDTAHITTSDYTPNSTKIAAEADILWTVNPSANVDVQITPDPEILVLDAAMGALGFTSPHKFFSEPLNRALRGVQRTYLAPASLQDRITDATLQAHTEEGQVCGRLVLNHREIHLKDYAKALVGADKEKLPLQIASAQLLGDQGIPTATTLIQQMLTQALQHKEG